MFIDLISTPRHIIQAAAMGEDEYYWDIEQRSPEVIIEWREKRLKITPKLDGDHSAELQAIKKIFRDDGRWIADGKN